MSDLIKKIKIKKQDGTYTDYIPIGAEAKNVDCSDGESVEYKLNKKPYYYNSVADMKADTNLKVGDMAITLGYHEANDDGGAEYRIVKGNYEDDGGSYHELDNNLYAKLIIRNEINVKQFGAYGDNVHDDTNAIQTAFNKYNKIYFTKGIYKTTETLTVTKPIEINGNNMNGITEYLQGFNTAINLDGQGDVIYYNPEAIHKKFKIMNIGITSTDPTSVGLHIIRANLFYVFNISVQNLTEGIGIKLGEGSGFSGQYGEIISCTTGMCKIGIQVNHVNGVNIRDCYLVGADKISDWDHGYIDDGIGIDVENSGDTCLISGNRVQNFQVCYKLASASTRCTDNRAEADYIGYLVTGDHNILRGNTHNNYIILAKNNVTNGRYGFAAQITGNYNIVDYIESGSSAGISDTGTDNNVGEFINIHIDNISEKQTIYIKPNSYLHYKRFRIQDLKLYVSNMSDVAAAGYANRWNISVPGKYIETYNLPTPDTDNFYTIANNMTGATQILAITFTPNGSAVELKNIDIYAQLIQYQ